MMQEANDATRQPYYSASELIMIIGAVGTVLASLLTGVVNVVIAWRNGKNLKDNTAITAATLTEAKVISGHVNSERSKLDERIVSKERENEILSRQLDDQAKTAALLAQTAAATVRMRQPDPNAPHNRRAEDKLVEQKLAQIEANTRETSEGIQELKG